MTDTDTDAARTTQTLRRLDAETDAVESAQPRVRARRRASAGQGTETAGLIRQEHPRRWPTRRSRSRTCSGF